MSTLDQNCKTQAKANFLIKLKAWSTANAQPVETTTVWTPSNIDDLHWLTASSRGNTFLPTLLTLGDAQNWPNKCNFAYSSFLDILKNCLRYKCGPYLTQSVTRSVVILCFRGLFAVRGKAKYHNRLLRASKKRCDDRQIHEEYLTLTLNVNRQMDRQTDGRTDGQTDATKRIISPASRLIKRSTSNARYTCHTTVILLTLMVIDWLRQVGQMDGLIGPKDTSVSADGQMDIWDRFCYLTTDMGGKDPVRLCIRWLRKFP